MTRMVLESIMQSEVSPADFTHLWNWKTKTNEQRWWWGGKGHTQTKRQMLKYGEQTGKCRRAGGWGGMGETGDGDQEHTCHDEHGVMYGIVESLYGITETNLPPYANYPEIKTKTCGAPGWLSRLSGQLRLRSWSHGPWVQALCRALCWPLGAWSLLGRLCLTLSLPLSCSHALSLSLSLFLSLKNKH